ncbi:MAG TPA: SWIM zinc finger family protein [Pyrinomonadaceae bacterium]
MATATATNTTTDKKAIMRDKRAQGIAAMGLVTREGDRFRVTTPSLRGKRSSYEVWRDDAGKVRCSCLEFEEQSVEDPTFRCEHVLAVKHSLLAKNSEAVTKQQPQTAARAAATETAETPNTNSTASEKRARPVEAPQADAATPRFGREQDEPETTNAGGEVAATAFAPTVSSLADHKQEEEQEEMSKRQATAVSEPEDDLDFVTAEEHAALSAGTPVVPLAFTNTLRTLRQPIDPKFIKTREGWRDRNGNTHMVEYVEWHMVADFLDRVVPTWSHSVRGIVQIGDMVAVTVAISIDGVTREGIGRELYQRESEVIEQTGSAPQNEFPRDPLAKSMGDLVTPKQLGMIRALAREAGVDVEEECQAVLRCRTEELSKKAASSFIDHLKNLQGGAAEQQQQPMRRAS